MQIKIIGFKPSSAFPVLCLAYRVFVLLVSSTPLINCLTKHLSSLWSENVCLNQMLTSDRAACWTVVPIMYENWITIRDAEAGIIHFSTGIWLTAMAHISCKSMAHNETERVVSDKWWKDYLLNSRIGRFLFLFIWPGSQRRLYMLLAF